ncbi:hypothetical protein SASPL_148308 [Salvia splendens]|uniref:DUF8040 domain-containing protein n=1 Tax=Salvia splendens TaxID=180675 RepID=A0A8X8W8W0_SALSN|nr:hypothetical protein SASPL_148308 [Salvia splendens]
MSDHDDVQQVCSAYLEIGTADIEVRANRDRTNGVGNGGGRVTQEVMIDSILAHVKQLDRLVRVSDRSCIDNLRMDRNTFGRLCRILRDRAGLIDQKFVTVEEQVAIFLSILAHHKKTRVVGHDFMRSSETVSKYTHMVLRGVLTLHEIMLVKPNPVGVELQDGYGSDHDDPVLPTINTVAQTPMWTKKRDDLAAAMWAHRASV